MRADDARETATAFTASKTSHNLRKSFSLKIHESKWLEAYREAVSFRRIATVEQSQLEYTHTQTVDTCTDTHSLASPTFPREGTSISENVALARLGHTQSQLHRIPRAATPRGIIIR